MGAPGDISGVQPGPTEWVGPWPAGWHVRHVERTGSTNADLLAAVDNGSAGHRSVLAASHQTAGRGRLDRRWEAPTGTNLLVSIALSPVPPVPAEVTHRIALAALAASREARPTADIGLKWPNDLLLDGRKLAGILAQRSSRTDAVVVGLGLNVGWAPEGAARLDARVTPAEVLQLVLTAFDQLPADIGPLYRSSLATIGQRIRVELPGGTAVSGTAVDVDDHGRLVVDGDDGVTAAYDAGDVVHLRPAT